MMFRHLLSLSVRVIGVAHSLRCSVTIYGSFLNEQTDFLLLKLSGFGLAAVVFALLVIGTGERSASAVLLF